jgi:hypothetical protein
MVSKLAASKLEQGMISKEGNTSHDGDDGSIVTPLPLFGRRFQSARVIPGLSSLQQRSVDSLPPPRPLERKRSTVRKRFAEIVSSAFQSQRKSRDGVAHNGKQNQRRSSSSTTVSPMVDNIFQSAELTEPSSSSSPEYQEEHGYATFPVSKCDLVGVDEKAVASMEGEDFGIMPRKECERPSSKADVQTNDNINVQHTHNDDGGSWYLADLESIIGEDEEEPLNGKMSSAPPSVPRRRQSRVSKNRRSDLESIGSGSKQKSKSRSSAPSNIDMERSSSTHMRRGGLSSRRTSTRHLDVSSDDTLRSSGSRRIPRGSVSCRNLRSSPPSTALSSGANEQEDVSKNKAISSKSSNQSEREDATSDDNALERRGLVRIQSCDPSQTRRPPRSTRSRVVDWRKKAEGFEELLDDLRVSSTEFRSHTTISKKDNTAEACGDDEKDSKENLQNSGNGKGIRRGNSFWTYHEEGPSTPAAGHDDRGSTSRPALTRQRSIKCLLLSEDNEDDVVTPMPSFFKKHSIRRRG